MKNLNFFLLLNFIGPFGLLSQDLHIVVTGDTKGYLFEENVELQKSGGVLERAAAIRTLRQEAGERFLLFDTGDAMGYHYLTTASQGELMLEAMANMGYDAMVVGNHEFDNGQDALKAFSENPKFPTILGANVLTEDSIPFLLPFKIINRGGLRIGVIGVADPQIKESVLEKNMKGLIIADPSWALHEYLPVMKNYCDLIILLSHLGEDANTEIASEFPALNAIVGKSNYIPSDHFASIHISGDYVTFIFSTEKYGRFIPHIRARVENKKIVEVQSVDLIEIDSEQIVVDELQRRQFKEHVDSAYVAHCRDRYGLRPESSVFSKTWTGTKELRDYLLTMMLDKTQSEVAIINERFLDYDSFLANATQTDTFTVRDYERIFWVENSLVTMNLTGEQLLAVLKRSQDYKKKNEDKFVHFKSANFDPKVTGFNIHGKPIERDQQYKVVTSNFLSHGGDGFQEFTKGKDIYDQFTGQERLKGDSLQGEEKGLRKTFVDYLITTNSRGIPTRFDKPVWFMTLRKIGLNAENKTKKNDQLYKEFSITELQGEEKVAFAANVDIKMSRLSRDYIFENYVKINYGKIKLGNQSYRESDDQWSIESLMDARLWQKSLGTGVAVSPFGSAKFQSEFTPNQAPLRKDFYLSSGAMFSDFGNFSENRIGLVHLTRFSQNEERVGNLGIGIHSLYSHLQTSYGNYSEFEFIYFFTKAARTQRQTASDSLNSNTRSLRFNWSSIISIEKWKDFYFNPGVNVFAFKGLGQRRWAYAVSLQFGLIFTTGWKIW